MMPKRSCTAFSRMATTIACFRNSSQSLGQIGPGVPLRRDVPTAPKASARAKFENS